MNWQKGKGEKLEWSGCLIISLVLSSSETKSTLCFVIYTPIEFAKSLYVLNHNIIEVEYPGMNCINLVLFFQLCACKSLK